MNKRVPGYSTDQIGDYLSRYIEESASSGTPFFAVAAPVAPHNSLGVNYPNNGTKFPYPLPKKEYEGLFQDLELPQSPNFNPENRTGVNAIWQLERLDKGNVGQLQEFYRMRQRTLKSVDDMIETIVQKLDAEGVLDNTYIIYTSDNGYHIVSLNEYLQRVSSVTRVCYASDSFADSRPTS